MGKRGRQVVDIETIFLGIVAQFALFLARHKAEGEIWHDRLSTKKRECRLQIAWKSGWLRIVDEAFLGRMLA